MHPERSSTTNPSQTTYSIIIFSSEPHTILGPERNTHLRRNKTKTHVASGLNFTSNSFRSTAVKTLCSSNFTFHASIAFLKVKSPHHSRMNDSHCGKEKED
ncbi:hypothetical protein OCU04_009412 [Sclerotinia nivalis]|uniref:Uncharacterized protein n=1 Tax=Sclerotinia nivalis TaxID=352851 RepID=A0A9X0DFH5_9HELO|nr:hypothetical protein OCU04_009412 [Sclerotinia nivalis]